MKRLIVNALYVLDMACNRCGEPIELVDDKGGVKSGRFEEEYECVNGHRGWVKGRAEESPRKWRKIGTVFQG